MLESIRVTEKLHWPQRELSTKRLLTPEEHELILLDESPVQNLSQSGILKDTFTTGTSSYNVLLQSKEGKKHLSQKHPLVYPKRHRKAAKSSCASRSSEHRRLRAPSPFLRGGWCCFNRQPALFISPVPPAGRLAHSFSVSGCGIGPSPRPKAKRRSFSSLTKPKQLPPSKEGGGGDAGRKLCILTAIKPSNVEREKVKFFKSDYSYNPQFEYASPAMANVLAKYSQASGTFLKQIVVHVTEDLLSRASMTVVNGRPTLTINIATAREHWLEGMLRHEIGTHYLRGINNNSQPWSNGAGRKKHGLKPINPTEEGLASIHSVLFRKDPFLWRAALLYYTVYQASQMSFSDLFQDIGRFVKDPSTRWDYCVRAKRGSTDTSQPGCFSKDQVYLDGILRILRYRQSIDFYLLTALGKVSYEDVERLKEFAVLENMRVPHFLQDHIRYMEHLEKIMEVNELSDKELQALVP
uniref:putative tyrosine carboxypeptidase MATCAP2 isoform X2 n=1 Tax=Euleptes europaea TaxID=460621 RepID=UPI00253F8E1A|nr:putative tyrosine carboxypeptidase MATCAP2 isoform X2 [Euleptes europaea]